MTSYTNSAPCKRQKVSHVFTEPRPEPDINASASIHPHMETQNVDFNIQNLITQMASLSLRPKKPPRTFLSLPREIRLQILLSSYTLECHWHVTNTGERLLIPMISINVAYNSHWYNKMEKVSLDSAFLEDAEFCKMVFLKRIVEGQEEEDRSWCAEELGVQLGERGRDISKWEI